MPDRNSTRLRRGLRRCAAGLAAAAALLALGARADEPSAAIVASISPVPSGLACSDAAAQARVSFDFAKPDFDVKQVSLYVDGEGVPTQSVQQNWPRVTLMAGLHPGRNTVEIVASGEGDRSIARQLTVLVGVPRQNGDDAAAVIDCSFDRTTVASTAPEVVDDDDQDVEAPTTVISSTVYVGEPVYVYHTYPAYPVWPVVVPVIPIVIGSYPPPVWYAPHRYCPPPTVGYYPAPPAVYRGPPHEPTGAPGGVYRTPMPVHGVPRPLQGGVPQPMGAPMTQGHRYTTQWEHANTGESMRWGQVSGTVGGPNTRYRTPAPGQSMPPPERGYPQPGGVIYEHHQQPQSRPQSPPPSRPQSRPQSQPQSRLQRPQGHGPQAQWGGGNATYYRVPNGGGFAHPQPVRSMPVSRPMPARMPAPVRAPMRAPMQNYGQHQR